MSLVIIIQIEVNWHSKIRMIGHCPASIIAQYHDSNMVAEFSDSTPWELKQLHLAILIYKILGVVGKYMKNYLISETPISQFDSWQTCTYNILSGLIIHRFETSRWGNQWCVNLWAMHRDRRGHWLLWVNWGVQPGGAYIVTINSCSEAIMPESGNAYYGAFLLQGNTLSYS